MEKQTKKQNAKKKNKTNNSQNNNDVKRKNASKKGTNHKVQSATKKKNSTQKAKITNSKPNQNKPVIQEQFDEKKQETKVTTPSKENPEVVLDRKSDQKLSRKEKMQIKKENKKEKRKQKKLRKKKGFFAEVKEELSLVTWPSRKKLIKYSIATIEFIIFFALYFYMIELIMAFAKSLI